MGKLLDSRIRNDLVDANAGVRQDCVLSPRLFCAARQESMQQSMRPVEQHVGREILLMPFFCLQTRREPCLPAGHVGGHIGRCWVAIECV